MKKSIPISNNFCPQTLFLYGTYKEDGSPNFGTFCWFSYYFDTELRVMACIGDKKLTQDRILANKIFSANLVTEDILPLADYMGRMKGYNSSKMDVQVDIEKGRVLNVPVLTKSPWIYELEVDKIIELDSSKILLCKIRNVLADEILCDETLTNEERIKAIAPAHSTCQSYFSWSGDFLGKWGEPMKKFLKL